VARRRRGFFAELQHQRLEQQRQELRFQKEQRRLTAQAARDAERTAQAANRAEVQAQREQRARYVEQRQAEADGLTNAVRDRVTEFESMLVRGLDRPATIQFGQLRKPLRTKPFVPGPLAVPEPAPRWEQFAPPALSGFGKIFGKSGHQRADQQARARFDEAVVAHRERERNRMAELADAEFRHAEAQEWLRQEIEKTNASVDELKHGFRRRTPQAVEDYFELVVEAAPLPAGLPVDAEIAYQHDARRLLVVRELPNVDVVPEALEYRYVRTRDEIDVRPRSVRDIRQHYTSLIAQIVLLTLRDVFDVRLDGGELVDEVAVNGHVSTRNKATGQPERPCLVSVAADRAQFAQLVLTELDSVQCLRHLNALVSPHPYDLEPVRPVFDPDLSRYRFVDAIDVAAGLDARPVLLELRPVEFEHLIRQLFEAMGMKAWVTQASRDDGVDAVAVNEDPIMGGQCVIQAKRYSGIVPVDAVRALAGVMDDMRASRGVLVTTSWYGKATHEFANRHGRIQLIEGGELKHLINEHLHRDVVIGPLKRRS
jgi:restriction system protein